LSAIEYALNEPFVKRVLIVIARFTDGKEPADEAGAVYNDRRLRAWAPARAR
jgi:hypothetical protein